MAQPRELILQLNDSISLVVPMFIKRGVFSCDLALPRMPTALDSSVDNSLCWSSSDIVAEVERLRGFIQFSNEEITDV